MSVSFFLFNCYCIDRLKFETVAKKLLFFKKKSFCQSRVNFSIVTDRGKQEIAQIPAVGGRSFSGNSLELLVEMGEVVEPTLVTDSADAEVFSGKQVAGMHNPVFVEKIDESPVVEFFKKTAECRWSHVDRFRYLIDRERTAEVFFHEFINLAHPLMVLWFKFQRHIIDVQGRAFSRFGHCL